MGQELVAFEVRGVSLVTLDQQHRKVIRLLAQLSECADSTVADPMRQTSEFLGLLAVLKESLQEQFRCEGELHHAVAYPLSELHCSKHGKLLNRIEQMGRKPSNTRQADLRALVKLLVDSLDEHTFFWDAAYRDFLREALPVSSLATNAGYAAVASDLGIPVSHFSSAIEHRQISSGAGAA